MKKEKKMKAFDNLVLKPCSLKDHTTQYAKKIKKGVQIQAEIISILCE